MKRHNEIALYVLIKVNTLKVITFFLLLILTTSCRKFVDIEPPKNQIISSEVFQDNITATSAVVGLYSQMMQSPLYLMNGGMTIYPGLSADEIYNTTASTTLDPFAKNTLLSNSTIVQNNLWRNAYIFIYQANACIEGLTNSNSITPSIKNQLLGEAKFIRAFCYFNLVGLFGGVPLVTGTDYNVNESIPRTATAKIYEQIIADLKDSQNLLSPSYPSTGVVRANKWAATALLARAYLYTGDWVNAETQSTAVINSGTYSLVPLTNVFLVDSKEAILEFLPVPGNNTSEGATFIPSSATVKPTYALTPQLLSAFEPNDLRKTSWLASNTVSTAQYYYPFKYKIRLNATIIENYVVLRLAEQYLIRAEARINQAGKISLGIADLNTVRTRARPIPTIAIPNPLPDINTSLSQTDALAAVAHERQIELFAEWGHRWLDLRRTGKIDAVLTLAKPGWQSFDALYPIPFTEIQKNPYLAQNQGYQ